VLGFSVARFLLGLGESGNFPAAVKATAEWFPPKERALATGIFNSGASVGAILAPLAVPWVALHFGWRASFLITGLFSAIWIVWWSVRYRTPHQTRSAGAIVPVSPRKTPAVAWWKLLRYRQAWGFMVGKFLTDPVWWFFLFWLPQYFSSRFKLDLSHIGLPLVVVYLFSTVGSVFGGWHAFGHGAEEGSPHRHAHLRLSCRSYLGSRWIAFRVARRGLVEPRRCGASRMVGKYFYDGV
jgi:ACS family hexuronate transporter-like MFS transporter